MTDLTDPSHCLNCGEALQGKFCYACGQKKFEAKERSLVHFIQQFFGAAFFMENSFIKNLWTLFRNPGLQALDHAEGRSKRWMAPFSVFFLINLIYFIVNPLTDFTLPLVDHLKYHFYSPFAQELVNERLSHRNITLSDYSELFNTEIVAYSKLLIILNVPVLALFLFPILFRKRRFFADHFIYALYFLSVLLLWASVWVTILNVLRWMGMPYQRWLLPLGLSAVVIYYAVASLKRFYTLKSWWGAIGITVILITGLVITVYLYRFFMFLTVFFLT